MESRIENSFKIIYKGHVCINDNQYLYTIYFLDNQNPSSEKILYRTINGMETSPLEEYLHSNLFYAEPDSVGYGETFNKHQVNEKDYIWDCKL